MPAPSPKPSPRPQQDDWYRHPKYYEAIFDADTQTELDFLEAANRLWGTGGKLWLEPACGAGRLVEGAVRRGYTLIGYDLTPEMLAHAKARLPEDLRHKAHLSEGRMESFAPKKWLGKVDLAFSLVSTFRYLDSQQAAKAHLESTRALLKPGGVFVLGFHLTDYARTWPEHERWVGQVGDEKVVCNTREWPPDRRARRARMRNRLTLSGPAEKAGRRTLETNWYFRTWSQKEAAALLAETGWELLALYGFDADLAEPQSWDGDRLDRLMVLGPASS